LNASARFSIPPTASPKRTFPEIGMCVAAPGRFLLNDSSVAALYERRIYSTHLECFRVYYNRIRVSSVFICG
jgi:hypothetical protein